MNKWMKQGVIGFALTSAAIAGYVEKNAQKGTGEAQLKQAVDALDFAGGSKLKDRMIQSTGYSVEFATVITPVEKIKA